MVKAGGRRYSYAMLETIKRAALRGVRAAGHRLLRLAHPPLAVQVPQGSTLGVRAQAVATERIAAERHESDVDRFAEIDRLLEAVSPWSGEVPPGYTVDFLGILIDGKFLWNEAGPFAGGHVSTNRPTVANYGEGWFEVADWLASAQEASGRYVAVSLGASFGRQLVGAWTALQALNPLPALLVAVEPVPENCAWMRSHMATNGINPDDHWIIQAVAAVDNEPVLFPVGAPGSGRNSCVEVNAAPFRQTTIDLLRRDNACDRVLENILLHNSTGIVRDFGLGLSGEVKFVSAVRLRDILAPLDRVDLLEVDIQRSEAEIFPSAMELVNRKVRRLHIGTHGSDVHNMLRALFGRAGWDIVFDYGPGKHITPRGPLDLGDGILSARNPAV
jgi:FkbM family methyltransferase